jgi:hypothetical protein
VDDLDAPAALRHVDDWADAALARAGMAGRSSDAGGGTSALGEGTGVAGTDPTAEGTAPALVTTVLATLLGVDLS